MEREKNLNLDTLGSICGTLLHKESLQSGSYLLNFDRICNPSLLSKNYFVVTNLLAKMSFHVSVFITSNKKWNLECSYAFHKKSPRRSKIWREKKILIWILWAAPPPLPLPHMLQLLARFLLLPQ
jgi:hypothetical protein